MPSGTHRHRPDHPAWWRGWVAAVIVICVLSFTGWVVYTRLIAPPVPIEQRPITTNALRVATRDTVVHKPVAPERIATIRKMANCSRADVDARVRAIADSFPRWSNWILASAACRQIRSSMTREQLRATLGEPTRIVPAIKAYRPIETWYYGNKLSVILWDGLVKSWQ
ncbi:MAG TPA: hypothetical protein VFS33_06260 [Gemmatimonadales bacterium]|nr:hypothetical protein [Gemmatimonadales bacterium]